jgi:hypothetical protein
MSQDVFVSYSARDKAVAEAVVAALEERRVRCWIAPRDVMPGVSWPHAITEAIKDSKALVVILSSDSVSSPQVVREVGFAADTGIPIIPFQIEHVEPPAGDWSFAVGRLASVDATTPPLEQHIERLYLGVQGLLGAEPQRRVEERGPSPAEVSPRPPKSLSLTERLRKLLKAGSRARRRPSPAATAPQPGTAREEPVPPKSKGYIFISYVQEDSDFVNRLRELLKATGYAYWDYTAGERDYHGALYRELEERIYGAAAFIAIVSDNWRHSDWVASEFTYARDAKKPIFVIQAKEMAKPVPILLNLQTRIDMSGKSEHGKQTLLEELAKKGL